MSNRSPAADVTERQRPRVVFFGMRCAFSVPPLTALLAAGCDVSAVVVPGLPGGPPLRLRQPERVRYPPFAGAGSLATTIDRVASAAGVPLLEVGALGDDRVVRAIADRAPEVIAVACFPWRVPRSVRELAVRGCLNVHPSLLPRWRGPEPIFWTFRAGDAVAGATVHVMDEGFDSGPVLAQQRVVVRSGTDGAELERELATLGGDLLARSIAGLLSGALTPVSQDHRHATTAPVPEDADLVLDTDKPARRVFDFVRGTAPLWGPLTVVDRDSMSTWAVSGALDFDEAGTQSAPIVATGSVLSVRCNPGLVYVSQCDAPDSAALTRVNQV